MFALALSALIACQDASINPIGGEVLLSSAQSGLKLTYMCGKRFRIRSSRTDTVRVRWDVYQKNDTGSVVVAGIVSPSTQSDVFFEATAVGTTRIFLGSMLVDTKANGNTVCSTSIPQGLGYPNDSSYVVVDSSTTPRVVYFRRIATVTLVKTMTDADVGAFMTQHQARILSGLPARRVYVIQLPDLGPSASAMWQRIDSILGDPRVITIRPAARVPMYINQSSWRFPEDASQERSGDFAFMGTAGVAREAWYGPQNRENWAMRAIGANAAWGCETGLYGSDAQLPAIAMLEVVPPQSVVLQASITLGGTTYTNDSIPCSDSISASNPFFANHARGVAGLITAQGDNGSGIAGVMWRTKLFGRSAQTPPCAIMG